MLFIIQSDITDFSKVLTDRLLAGSRVKQHWKVAYVTGGIEKLFSYQQGKTK